MSLRHKIARRRRALQWFERSEADPAAVLFGKPPSKRLCRLMHREELLDVEPIAFGQWRWRLTNLGRSIMRPDNADT